MSTEKKHSFNCLLNQNLFDMLTEIARHQEVSRGAVMRAAIRYHGARLRAKKMTGLQPTDATLDLIPDELFEPIEAPVLPTDDEIA